MDHASEIRNVVGFFQTAFNFIFALALTESFKQFVADKAEKEEERHIHWDRSWSLLSFLFLIIPFFQGTNRYYYTEYLSGKMPEPYSAWLMVDVVMFLAEAGLFFVMSRTLAPVLWRRFYYSVLWLCLVDSIWAFIAWVAHSAPIVSWLGLNVITAIVITAFIQIVSNNRTACIVGAIIVLVRTVFDYYLSWSFYFPAS